MTGIPMINILLCDTFPGLLPPDIPSYASMFRDLFRSVADPVAFKVFPAMAGILPPKLEKDELYLITGSNSSAYDNEPWILELLQWVRDAAARHIKLVGICFGHQIIAQALGGEVRRHPGGWGIGIRESSISDEAMRPYFPGGHLRLLYNHHDQVTKLPADAVVLAHSQFCRYEGYRIGHEILTFQGHPEYTPEYELHLIKNHSQDEDEHVKNEAIKSIKRMRHQGASVARFILHFYNLASSPHLSK
jgi:GMP synthase-like glutamine amidotransferase